MGKTPVTRAAASVALIAGIALIAGVLGAYIYTKWNQDESSKTKLVNPQPPEKLVSVAPSPPPAPTGKDDDRAQEETKAQADAERAAESEREKQEAKQKAEEAERERQRVLEEKRKREAEMKRKNREQAKNAAPKPPTPVAAVASPAPAPAPPATAPAPRPDCPLQGDNAIYICYRERALDGDALAALKLGELVETGRGTRQSDSLAYYWYARAAQGGAAGAPAQRDAVKKRLQPVQIRQMDDLLQSQPRPGK
jgi:outer membrane biosynthesis protein TonB